MGDYFFQESEDGYGRVFVPKGPWRPEYNELIARQKVKVVRLSDSMGWKGPDVDFLAELHFLEGVEIYSWDVRDASVIGLMNQLRLVGLQCDLRKQIDFSALRRLEVVKATWKKQLSGVLQCRELKHLNLTNWPQEDLEALEGMRKLAVLQLTSRKLTSLDGISKLAALERLDLHACPKLTSLAASRSCARIHHLEISSCRGVSNLSAVGTLQALRVLALDDCGDIDSLTPIQSCRDLETLSFLGTTRVLDGDLALISDFPRLRKLRFAPRRHIS